MANRSAVKQEVDKVHRAKMAEEKLDALANAINELARYLGNVEDKLSAGIYEIKSNMR